MISPDSLTITREMLNLIGEIDEFKGAWRQMGRLTPDRLSMLKKVATIESIGSSTRIEGSKLLDNEIEKLLSNTDTDVFHTRDEQEVGGYALVCQQIYDHYELMPLTENLIKQLHSSLLQYTDKDVRHRGEYKKIPIRIEAFDADKKSVGVIFETTSPLATPFKMGDLVSWTNEAFQKQVFHPLIIIGLFVLIFLAIHPFQDGNGRLSRLLTTLLMLKSGYLYAPYSSLESIIEANKEAYYLALQKSQKNWQDPKSEWNAWLLFFLRSLQRQKRHLEAKLEKEQILLKNLSPLSQNILDVLSSHGRLGIREIEAITKANRNTLKKALAALLKDNYISKHGLGKGSWYTSNI
jgi:Fic family protein